MAFKERYEKNKELLLKDKNINSENKKLFKEFFDIEEEKLKRINDNAKLDEPSYKTLFGYINKFKNVNIWFKNRAWKNLTEADIKKVYDDLEEGRITNRYGERFGDRRGYYNKVFKSLPFELAGKKTEVLKALRLYTDRKRKEVNFVNEEGFKKLVAVVSKPEHLALLWLSWDVGENINSLLQLKRSNFIRQENKSTKEAEYKVWLPHQQLKRSRTPRSELTLFPETFRYLDIILDGLTPDDLVFKFGYRQSLKFFDSASKKSKVVCEPTGKKPSWKDLRSGMCVNLFSNYNWGADDINLRLGHNVTSRELESYFGYCANKGKKAKKLHFNNNLEKVNDELNEMKIREKGSLSRLSEQDSEIGNLNRLTKLLLEKELGKIDEKKFKNEIKGLVDNLNRSV